MLLALLYHRKILWGSSRILLALLLQPLLSFRDIYLLAGMLPPYPIAGYSNPGVVQSLKASPSFPGASFVHMSHHSLYHVLGKPSPTFRAFEFLDRIISSSLDHVYPFSIDYFCALRNILLVDSNCQDVYTWMNLLRLARSGWPDLIGGNRMTKTVGMTTTISGHGRTYNHTKN